MAHKIFLYSYKIYLYWKWVGESRLALFSPIYRIQLSFLNLLFSGIKLNLYITESERRYIQREVNEWTDRWLRGRLGWGFYEWWCGWVNRTYLAASNVTSNKQGTSLLSTLDIIRVDFLFNVRKCCHGIHKMTNPPAFI